MKQQLSQQYFTKTDNFALHNQSSFVILLNKNEFMFDLQLFSFAFKLVQTNMYCICIVAKPNLVILFIRFRAALGSENIAAKS